MSDDEREWTPDLGRLTQAADDAFTVGRVFGQAYEHQGTLVIPVARVLGAAGTGAGGGAGNGSGAASGNGSGHGTGHGSGDGTGRGSGRGSFSFLRHGSVAASRRIGSAEDAPTEDAASESVDAPEALGTGNVRPGNESGANGDAHAEAKGDLQAEARGEATGEARGDARGEGGAGGGAYGVRVKPVGVVVVENGSTRWIPVFDLNRTIVGGQAVAAVAAVALAWAIGRRRR